MLQMPFLKMKTKFTRTSLERKAGLRVCQKSTTIANNSWTNFRISKHAAEFDSSIHNFFNVSSNEKHALKSGCYDNLEGKEILDGERIHFQKQPPSFIDPVSTESADITVVLPNMEAFLSPISASPETHHGELINVHTAPQATRTYICGPHGVIPDEIDGRDEPWRLRAEDNGCGVSEFSIPEAADLTLDLSLFSDNMYAVDGDMFFGLNGDYLMMHFCDDSSVTDLLDFKLSEMAVDHDDTSTPFSMLTEQRPITQDPDLVRYESGLSDCLNSFFLCEDLPDSSETTPSPSDEAPRKSVTLVLDLDETLVHSSMVECKDADFSFTVECNMKQQKVYVKRRPYLTQFLKRVAEIFDVIVFTASQSNYGEQLLDVIDPGRKLISRRAFRESCVFSDGSYTKDLTVLGLDLAKVAIIDNSPQVFRLQVNNGIPIMSWFDDPSDCALITLLPFLERLAEADDVRPIIAEKFGKTVGVSF